MTIYGRSGEPVTIVRWGTLDDVQKLDGRKPDKTDRAAIANDSYLVVRFDDDGTEQLYHQAYLRADGGAQEIAVARDALPRPLTKEMFSSLPAGTAVEHHAICADGRRWIPATIAGRSAGKMVLRIAITRADGSIFEMALPLSDAMKTVRVPATTADPMTVKCTECGALPDEQCFAEANGRIRLVDIHAERLSASVNARG
jgi:hypothetical protein